jgi:hypothetical protein
MSHTPTLTTLTQRNAFEAKLRERLDYPVGPLTVEKIEEFQRIELERFRASTGLRTATKNEVESNAAKLPQLLSLGLD